MVLLNKKSIETRKQISFVCVEDLVPENHILRDIESSLDFSFIYEEVKDLYAEEIGRPSIDPVVLFKMILLQYLFGIRSMRQTCKEIEVNMAYRWFLGYDLHEKTPHFSTFGKNYERRFSDSNIFEKIFERILAEAVNCGFVDTSAVFIDATHIKACANNKKFKNDVIKIEAKQYQNELKEEINGDRERHNKKPLKDKNDDSITKTRNIKKSTTDPDSGIFRKGEHKVVFAYTANTACCKNNFVLGVEVSAGNIHDSVSFDPLYKNVKAKFPEIGVIAVDSGYKTPWIAKQIIDDGIIPAMPYKRPMTKQGFFKKYEYVYDEYYDEIICPNNQILKYSTTNRDGYQEYKSNPNVCEGCPYITKCTDSKAHQKVVSRHVWEEYLEKAEDLRHTPVWKSISPLRAQTIERVFADAKEKQNMRYTQLKGKAKVRMQVLLTFACQNLKKLAKWKRKNGMLHPFLCVYLLLKRNFKQNYNFA